MYFNNELNITQQALFLVNPMAKTWFTFHILFFLGVEASQKIIAQDMTRINKYKNCFITAGKENGMIIYFSHLNHRFRIHSITDIRPSNVTQHLYFFN